MLLLGWLLLGWLFLAFCCSWLDLLDCPLRSKIIILKRSSSVIPKAKLCCKCFYFSPEFVIIHLLGLLLRFVLCHAAVFTDVLQLVDNGKYAWQYCAASTVKFLTAKCTLANQHKGGVDQQRGMLRSV